MLAVHQIKPTFDAGLVGCEEVDNLCAVAHVGEGVRSERSEERLDELFLMKGKHGSRGDASLAPEAHAAECAW